MVDLCECSSGVGDVVSCQRQHVKGVAEMFRLWRFSDGWSIQLWKLNIDYMQPFLFCGYRLYVRWNDRDIKTLRWGDPDFKRR